MNAKPYRQAGILCRGHRQYTSCYGRDGLDVYSRDLNTGAVECRTFTDITAPGDAHVSPSLGFGPDGSLHVLTGAHFTHSIYLRSPDGSLNSLEIVEDPVISVLRMTYPLFVNDAQGGLHLIYRTGSFGSSIWRVQRWDEVWKEDSLVLVDGVVENGWSAGPYLNSPLADAGSGTGFFVVWRSSQLPQSHQRVMNIGVDYFDVDLSSEQTSTWSGVHLPLPITPAVSERVIAVPWGAELCNQAGAARLPDGRPVGVFFWNEGRITGIYAVLPVAKGWVVRRAGTLDTPIEMAGPGTLSTTYSRPACVAFPDGRLIIVIRGRTADEGLFAYVLSGPDYSESLCRKILLLNRDLGDYEPVIDVSRGMRDGVLSIYIQSCLHTPDSRTPAQSAYSDAVIAEWDAAALGAGT